MSFAILGMGTAVPATSFDQAEGLGVARSLLRPTREQATWLPTMYEGTGIQKRHIVLSRLVVDDMLQGTKKSASVFLSTGQPGDRGPTTSQRMDIYGQEAPPLAAVAAQRALNQSGLAAEAVTHLVTVSCSGFLAPGMDTALIEDLHLRSTIERAQIGFMGCHGALNGLRVARAFTSADPGARVLLCAVELCSLHYYYQWDPGRIIANALFADGAAAVVGAASAVAAADSWQVAATGSCVFSNTRDAMTWTIGDHGFVMRLSKKVPGLIQAHLRPWLAGWLAEQHLRMDDISSWAIHPGGPRILAAVEEALGLPRSKTEAAHAVFAEYGNMSSPTVLFILDRLRSGAAARPCVALGFGPGLAAEAALFL